MSLFVIGLNFRTAPISLRERVANHLQDVQALITKIVSTNLATEAVLLSTCNRIEFYLVKSSQADPVDIVNFLSVYSDIPQQKLQNCLYIHTAKDALRHIFRVISSLDSMIVGENQIVSQVRTASRVAQQAKTIGSMLRRIIDKGFQVSKRIRTETDISKEKVSIGSAGVLLATQVLGDLHERSALLIGAGEHGKVIAKNLFSNGLSELIIANRTFEHAVALAQHFGASAIPLTDINRYLDRVDIILTSIGGGEIVISQNDLMRSRSNKGYRTLVMIDLSIPRVIESNLQYIDDVFLFDVDDLMQIADQGRQKRKKSAKQAEAIVDEEIDKFWDVMQVKQRSNEIGNIFRHADSIRNGELEKTFSAMPHLTLADKQLIESMTKAVVKKILHNPISQAKQCAKTNQEENLNFLLKAMLSTDSKNE